MKNHFFAVVDQLAASLLAFVFHVVAARTFSSAIYGELVLVWGAVGTAVLLWRAAVGVPFVVEFSSLDEEGRGRLLRDLRGNLVLFGASVLGLAALLTGASRYWAVSGQTGAGVFLASGALMAAMLYREEVRHGLMADLAFPSLGRMGAVSNLLGAMVFAGICAVHATDPNVALAGMAVGITLGSTARCTLRKPSLRTATDSVRRWWVFGKHIVVGVVALAGVSQVLLWGVAVAGGSAEVATIGVTLAIVGLPRPAIAAITSYLTPTIARNPVRLASMRLVRWRLWSTVGISVVFVCTFTAAGPTVIGWMFPGVNPPGHLAIGLIAGSIAFEAVNAVYRARLRGLGAAVAEGQVSAVAASASLAVGIAAVPMSPVLGAAAAMLVMQLAFVIASAVVCKQVQPPTGAVLPA